MRSPYLDFSRSLISVGQYNSPAVGRLRTAPHHQRRPRFTKRKRILHFTFTFSFARAASPLLRQLSRAGIAMSVPEQPAGSSKQYHSINISEGARAQLGDTYHAYHGETYNFSQFPAGMRVGSQCKLMRNRPRRPTQPSPFCNKCAIQFLQSPTRIHLPPRNPCRPSKRNI